jgi:DNA damage-binding protein 1
MAEGGHVKTMIFGGMDGILTSFAIVAGAAGGGMGWDVVLVMGFSNVLADALSMGVGEYLSSKAHKDFVLSEKKREEWEYDNYKEGEVKEMIELYVQRGMDEADAEIVINKMAKYRDFFIDVMMVEELGLQEPDEDAEILWEGVLMFFRFAFFGSLPLLGYAIFPSFVDDDSTLFYIACAVTGFALFLMGTVKSRFSLQKWYSSGLETLVLGAICAAVAYELGNLTSDLVN